MNFKKTIIAASLLGASVMATSASAGILDEWQFDSTVKGGGLTTNIGHIVVSGGQATITQELDAGGGLFVGARFKEFGGIFTLSFTPESCPGACDSGTPNLLVGETHSIGFSGLSGTVSSISGTSFGFNFDTGAGDIWMNFGAIGSGPGDTNQLATFNMASPSGGSLANFFGAANTSGTSNILALVASSLPGVFKDSTGAALAPGNFYIVMDTTNQIRTPAVSLPAADCSSMWTGVTNCSELVVTSQGKIDLMRIPEPATLALLSVGLLGLGGMVRRNKLNSAL